MLHPLVHHATCSPPLSTTHASFLPVIYYDPKANPLAVAKGAVNYTNIFSAAAAVPIPRVR